jgi:protein CrcB
MGTALSSRRRLLAVLAGGFCGTITRALLSTTLQSHFGNGWPYDILLINVTGAFLLAFFTTLADATILIGPTRRLFINVGFLGAYTTFSSLALGDVLLLSKGMWLLAIFYLLCSFIGGLLAVLLGEWSGQRIVRRVKQPQVRVLPQPTETALAQTIDVLENDDADLQGDMKIR